MRRNLLYGAILLALILGMGNSSMAASEPEILIENVEPQPANPGDTITISIIAQNSGEDDANYLPIKVETSEGMQVLGRTSFKSDFDLCGGCQKVGKFYVKISEDARSGSYPIKFRLVNSKSKMGVVEDATVNVDGNPNIIVSTDEVEVLQEGKTSFELVVKNTGTDVSTQTTISLESSEMSFTPSKFDLGSLEAGETIKKTIKLRTGDEVKPGPSKIIANIDYRDESKNLRKNSSFSAYILKNAEISLSQLQIDEAYIGSETRLMVELENTGPGEASKLTSELSCENAVVKDAKSFVGSLDSDESVPTVYRIVPSSENIQCSLETSYTDSSEMKTSESFEVNASKKKTNFLPIIGVITIIVLIGLYYWKKRGQDEAEEV